MPYARYSCQFEHNVSSSSSQSPPRNDTKWIVVDSSHSMFIAFLPSTHTSSHIFKCRASLEARQEIADCRSDLAAAHLKGEVAGVEEAHVGVWNVTLTPAGVVARSGVPDAPPGKRRRIVISVRVAGPSGGLPSCCRAASHRVGNSFFSTPMPSPDCSALLYASVASLQFFFAGGLHAASISSRSF
jgi:hypothetical protein